MEKCDIVFILKAKKKKRKKDFVFVRSGNELLYQCIYTSFFIGTANGQDIIITPIIVIFNTVQSRITIMPILWSQRQLLFLLHHPNPAPYSTISLIHYNQNQIRSKVPTHYSLQSMMNQIILDGIQLKALPIDFHRIRTLIQ